MSVMTSTTAILTIAEEEEDWNVVRAESIWLRRSGLLACSALALQMCVSDNAVSSWRARGCELVGG